MKTITSVNLSNVDLNLLVTLDAVLNARSATLAAAHLHITQSAVSNALKRARQLFDDALVVRQGNGFALTPRAEALAPRLREVLHDMKGLLQGDEARAPRCVTLACVDTVSIALLPSLLRLLQQHLPETQLRSVTPDSVQQVGLDRSDVDVIVGAPHQVPAGCDTEDLFEDPMVVIAAANHPTVTSRLTLETYTSLPHAELALFGEPEDRVDRALATRGLTRRTDVLVPYLSALPFLVSHSERIATVTRSTAHRFAEPLHLRVYPPPIPLPPVTIKMIWHRRRTDDPTHRSVRDLLCLAARHVARTAASQTQRRRAIRRSTHRVPSRS